MLNAQLKFDFQKAVETVLYVVNRIDDPTFMSVAKILYFADKTSLETFGRFITGDTYVAMKNGPVPTSTYDLMKAGKDSDVYGFEVIAQYHLRPLREANLDELSDSDVECLDKVITAYGHLPWWQLRDLSHDAAWEQTWKEAGERGSAPIPLERVIELFDDSEVLLDYLINGNSD